MSLLHIPQPICCPVCINILETAHDVMVYLPCAHILCNHCYEQLELSSCPLCRKSFTRRHAIPKSLINCWKKDIKDIISEVISSNEMLSASHEGHFANNNTSVIDLLNMSSVEWPDLSVEIPPNRRGRGGRGRRRREQQIREDWGLE